MRRGDLGFLILGLGILPLGHSALAADAPTESLALEQKDSVFGKKTGFNYDMGANDEQNGVLALLVAKLMGKDLSLLEAAAQTTNLLEGETELTLAGMKVWNQKSEFKNGKYTYSAGVPTTQSRLKVVTLPVGPITVNVDAGLAYDAAIEGSLSPHFSIPIEYTAIGAELATKIDVAGFIEGYAQFLFLRGGVGGQVDIVRGKAGLNAELAISELQRRIDFTGFLQTLSGKFYAFADSFSIFGMRWKRFWQPTIAEWKGYCFQLNPKKPDPDAPCGN